MKETINRITSVSSFFTIWMFLNFFTPHGLAKYISTIIIFQGSEIVFCIISWIVTLVLAIIAIVLNRNKLRKNVGVVLVVLQVALLPLAFFSVNSAVFANIFLIVMLCVYIGSAIWFWRFPHNTPELKI